MWSSSKLIRPYLLVGMLIIVMSGCQFSDAPKIEKAKAILATVLKDPASAQYRNIYIQNMPKEVVEKQGVSWIVCGEVNSKNSFGGYTGFKRFLVNEKSSLPIYEEMMNSKRDKESFELLYQGCASSSISKAWK